MKEIRLIVFLTFGVIFSLITLSGILIFFEKGGSAQFNILGQEFSSTNIGLAVLALAIVIFIYVIRDLYKSKLDSGAETKVYKTLNHGVITWTEVIDGCQKLVLQLC